MDPLIQVRGLTYRYPNGVTALKGADLDLYPGESVIFFGPNGSGKTTFVLHLNGLLRATQGEITVCGLRAISENMRHIRQAVGMVFQNSDDQLVLPSILEDVSFGPANLNLTQDEARARAVSALADVGIHDGYQRAPWNLSAGEKRRVAIAGVLAMRPEILVLDEPTMFLDPPGRRDLITTLRKLPQAKIIVTHDVPFARATGTRAVFFDEGRIAAAGPVEEIVRQFDWNN